MNLQALNVPQYLVKDARPRLACSLNFKEGHASFTRQRKNMRLGISKDELFGKDEGKADEEKEPTFDKYRVIKRQTSYADPEHYERLKKYLYEDNPNWGQHRYPTRNDDIDEDEEYMTVPTEHSMSGSPENPSLEKSLTTDLATALNEEKPDIEASKYWFTKEPEGVEIGRRRVKKAEKVVSDFACAENYGEGRIPVNQLKPGQEYEGVITEIWLHHGAKIDFGATYDGIVYVSEDQWSNLTLRKELRPGRKVTLKILKIWDESIHRWPVQLELLDPDVMGLLLPPEDWPRPCDLRGQTDVQIKRLAGREFEEKDVMIPKTEGQIAEALARKHGVITNRGQMVGYEAVMLEHFDQASSHSAVLLYNEIENDFLYGHNCL